MVILISAGPPMIGLLIGSLPGSSWTCVDASVVFFAASLQENHNVKKHKKKRNLISTRLGHKSSQLSYNKKMICLKLPYNSICVEEPGILNRQCYLILCHGDAIILYFFMSCMVSMLVKKQYDT